MDGDCMERGTSSAWNVGELGMEFRGGGMEFRWSKIRNLAHTISFMTEYYVTIIEQSITFKVGRDFILFCNAELKT